jgi:hypothetical protein
MKLDQTAMDLVYNVAQTANIVGIDSVSIEDNDIGRMVRGFSTDLGTPIVISHPLVNPIPYRAFAIHDCRSFLTKVKLAIQRDNKFTQTVNISENTNIVTDIEFKGSGFKLKFNAGKPDAVKAPKGIKDDIVGNFKLSKMDIDTLSNSISAMSGEYVTFIYDGSSLQFEVTGLSTSKDVFICDIASSLNVRNDTIKPFSHAYLFKAILPALKACDGQVQITTRGLLNCIINDINVFIFPRKA